VYAFKVTPAVGYAVKGKADENDSGSPWIKYIKQTKSGAGTTEEEVKIALTSDSSGNYFFKIADLEGLKEGSQIEIGAEFDINNIEIKTQILQAGTPVAEGGQIPGEIKITEGQSAGEGTKAQEGKKVSFTVTTNDNNNSSASSQYAKAYISYTLDGQDIKKELEAKDGTYSFTMPNAEVTIIADFFNQSIALSAADDSGSPCTDVQLSASAGAVGQEITVSLTDEAVKAGKKITNFKVSYQKENPDGDPYVDTHAAIFSEGAWRFKIPSKIRLGTDEYNLDTDVINITVIPVIEGKGITVKTSPTTNGSVTLSNDFADKGEAYSFTVKPNSGYKVSSVTVTLTSSDKKKSKKVTATGSGETYSVNLPDDEAFASGATADINVIFTPGVQPGSGAGKNGRQTVSAGVSVAVGVVINKNYATVENAEIEAAGLKVTANGTTTNKTEALAGFSAGQIGIGGAVAVQVDTVKTDAVVKDTAHVTLTGGPLNVTAANTVKLDTKASAKGAAKSENAGVGAG
ncbi:MAG: hypothetical protein IJ107_01745, partial [Lachnospiraceae bacterium]|nr:hypothetical protein [Lachnospiraceae bacterium]